MNRPYRIRESLPNSIVILRALQLGDLLCAVPAFRALRHANPDARIALVGLPWARNFVERFNHYLDEYIEFPGYPGLPEITPQIQNIPAFLQELQMRKFDLALQMQGSGYITNSLVMLFGAENNAGFFLPGQYCPDDTNFLPYPVHESEVFRHLRLMEYLDIPLQGTYLEFPITDEEWDAARDILEQYQLTVGEYVCIHPGARAVERRWSPDGFAQVADGMANHGFKIVLTGTAAESAITREVNNLMNKPGIDLAGKTSIGVFAALLKNSRLLVCNDTGVSHLAAALKVPSIILFLASDPKRWAPLNRQLHRVISWGTAVTPQAVLLEVEEILQDEYSYAS